MLQRHMKHLYRWLSWSVVMIALPAFLPRVNIQIHTLDVVHYMGLTGLPLGADIRQGLPSRWQPVFIAGLSPGFLEFCKITRQYNRGPLFSQPGYPFPQYFLAQHPSGYNQRYVIVSPVGIP